MIKRDARLWALLVLALLVSGPASAGAERPELSLRPAEIRAGETAQRQVLLASARAGGRLVAVGARGTVLLSDDDGASFRQARSVPAQASLTSVSFIDARRGWAVGHWGVILTTSDGGESWEVQRSDIAADRPLFAIHAFSTDDAVAVGLWSLVLVTHDGGKTWTEQALPVPPGAKKADLNLFAAFPGRGGTLFVTAEGGQLLRSDDRGGSWVYVDTGYRGTFWTGLGLADGTLLVGGLRGTVYRSADGGRSWQPAVTSARSSVTHLVQAADGSVLGTALDGVSLVSSDGGRTFQASQREDRAALTTIQPTAAQPLVFSKQGILRP